ncbi:hypothetical protein EB796_004408 [Bugula neritina]|uniref:DNA polymerase alpha subunit B n=1 Tax=Bugula neritina TaxID=10212 RepID=A0A7J7KHC3_BUGNE|nr:hypothetical protein EB796_004408 [Bugula neritina]
MLEVEKSPPDVLILMGPFINEENQVLQHSLESYEMLFDSVMNEIFSKVIPINDRDLHHEPVYPTPPYHLNLQHPRVHLVANLPL